jgi:C-terminal processing protease CtpA/Prc
MGLYAQEHQPHEEQLRIIKKQYSGSYLSTLRCRVFSVKEIDPVFKASSQDLDPTVVVMTKQEHKRRLWLGIEYDVMNKALAQVMGLQKETKNGKIGLLVSKLYNSSPAGRGGLELGDILLFIQEPDKPPLELAFEKSYGSSYNPYAYFNISGYDCMDYGQRRPPLWPPRKNQLTNMLEVVGKDKKIRVGFLRQNQYREKDLVIRMAPNDFLSTEKYINKKIGLTVKDFTYEVMDALQLGQGRHGIVVAKVDPGSPAAVGRVKMFEIIEAIDGKPIKNIKHFKKKIEKALSRKRKSVKLTVRDLDKTRFIDLVFNDK